MHLTKKLSKLWQYYCYIFQQYKLQYMPDIIEITAIIFQLLFINSIIVLLKVVKIVKVSVPQLKNKNVQPPMQNSAKP